MRLIINFSVLLLCIFIMFPSLLTGDSVEYFYDDNGRLVRVVIGTEGLIYHYDAVGNLISISKGTISQEPPIIQSINPDVLFIGSTTPVTIKGQNLFTTKEVTSDSLYLSIGNIDVTDTEIKTEITVSPDALPDTVVNITVTTLYASASIQATLTSSKLTFSPGQIALTPESSGDITADISPTIGKDLTITLNNSNPNVASTPQLLTIPSNGTTTFTVNALNEGITIISSGEPRTTVFVTQSFTPEPGEEVTSSAGPVSVHIDAPAGDSSVQSLPVSVYIETPSGDIITASLPVSVYIETSQGNATTASLPVSVYIETPLGDSTVVSPLVSVTAIFEACSNLPVKIGDIYYSTLQSAYDASVEGNTIQSQAVHFIGDLNINRDISVTLAGGYDCDYATNSGKTTLKGTMTITNGTLTTGNFVIE